MYLLWTITYDIEMPLVAAKLNEFRQKEGTNYVHSNVNLDDTFTRMPYNLYTEGKRVQDDFRKFPEDKMTVPLRIPNLKSPGSFTHKHE